MSKIKKAIISLIEQEDIFSPLVKSIPRELLPLADKPLIQYLVEEVAASGIPEILFINRPGSQAVSNYFKPSAKLAKAVKEPQKDLSLSKTQGFDNFTKHLTFSSVASKKALGDGHAIWQAKRVIGQDAYAVLLPYDIIHSKEPSLAQLYYVFKTCQKPIVGLKKIPQGEICSQPCVKAEKIASRLYKIREIMDCSSAREGSSSLAIVGRFILTPDIFASLQKVARQKRVLAQRRKETTLGDPVISLTEGLESMLEDGKIVYGYEIDGECLECRDKTQWLKANLYFSLRHPELGPELKRFLDQIK